MCCTFGILVLSLFQTSTEFSAANKESSEKGRIALMGEKRRMSLSEIPEQMEVIE